MNFNKKEPVIIFILIFIINHASYGMENYLNIHNTIIDKQNSLVNFEYNCKNPFLLQLPKEQLFYFIVDHSIDKTKPLKEIIKPFLLLSTTCKYFHSRFEKLIPIVGKSCNSYFSKEKNKAMKMLLESMNDLNYYNKRNAALFLTFAGAKNNVSIFPSLLCKAIWQKDISMINILFKHNVDPNQKEKMGGSPTFFSIENVEIAKMFAKKGTNFAAEGSSEEPTILFKCLKRSDSLELINFYLNYNIDLTKINKNGDCLLHYIPNGCEKPENWTEIARLLIGKNPELLNLKNNQGETPLDIINKKLEEKKEHELFLLRNDFNVCLNHNNCFYHLLIELYKKHGGQGIIQPKRNFFREQLWQKYGNSKIV